MEYKVRLQGSDGNEYLITYGGLSDALKNVRGYDEKIGWNQVTRSLREDVSALRDLMLSEILVPKAQQEILKLIKENPNIRTGDLTDHFKNPNRFMHLAFCHAWDKLEDSNRIVATSHGRGKQRTWNIKEA